MVQVDHGGAQGHVLGQGEVEVKAEAQTGIRLGISGVPAFVLEGDVIASGAQTPDQFVQLLTRVYANYSV